MTEHPFNFPYPPYDVQKNFMSALYECLEAGKLGILESPTGTGKTLSLLCSSLKWLNDYETRKQMQLNVKICDIEAEIKTGEDEIKVSTDWISLQHKVGELKRQFLDEKNKLKLVTDYEKSMETLKSRIIVGKKKRTANTFVKRKTEENLLDPCENNIDSIGTPSPDEIDPFELNVDEDRDENKSDDEDEKTDEEKQRYTGVKIFYSSRTHSQLNQVSNEIKKTVYGKDIRVVSLASRQNYCINSTVKSLNTNELINERCCDLQKSKSQTLKVHNSDNNRKKSRVTVKSSKCPFYVKEKIEDLKNELICEINDIEDLVKIGVETKACPYYASRLAIDDAHLILLPYQMLLNKKIRDQFKIDVNNHVVIVDEAHNLLDTLNDMHSATIGLEQLEKCLDQLTCYRNKYMNRMRSTNLVEFNKLIFIVKRLKTFLVESRPKSSSMGKNHRMMSAIDLCFEGEFHNLNILDVLRFCEETRLADKVHGFVKNYQENVATTLDTNDGEESSTKRLLKNLEDLHKKEAESKLSKKKKSAIKIESEGQKVMPSENKENHPVVVPSVIRPVLRFLECLTDKAGAGGVLVNYGISETTKSFMKYILLKPGEHFKEILNGCRSLILAGGTMQPTAEIKNMLLGDHQQGIEEHFFGHVVSQDACLPLVIKKGPRGENFLFTYNNRSNPKLDLGSVLLNVCSLVPHGIVCFFPSYDYLGEFQKYLGDRLLVEIEKKKQVFTEPRIRDQVEKVLNRYRLANEGSAARGAILFSVVGGKLSEGLNFCDNLGRCVIVVGMPYPNKNSPELVEKMANYNQTFGQNAGSVYYENLCMKSVNQSIGRAIRHINDYASILLVDERYGKDDVLKRLPQWIRSALRIPVSYGQGQMFLAQFFAKKKKLLKNV